MAKLHEVKCLISGITLGIGCSKEEAELNAEHTDSNWLIIEGGRFKRELLVTDLAIKEPTYVRIMQVDKPIVRVEGFRTLNIGIYGDDKKCAAVAQQLLVMLEDVDPVAVCAAVALGSLGIFNPTFVNDIEDAPEELLVPEHSDPSPEELKNMAMTLAGPNHEVGELADLSQPAVKLGDTITAVGTTLKVTENGLEKVDDNQQTR